MKKAVLLLILLALSCSKPREAAPPASSAAPAQPAAAAPTEVSAATEGEAYGLRFAGEALTFCDKRGGRRLDLITGKDAASEQACPKMEEANTSCSGLNPEVDVRAPQGEPNDIVDAGGKSFPMKGRVHDCAADGKALAIATASTVVLIDLAKGESVEISGTGGDRVAVRPGWIAWTEGSKIRAKSNAAIP